MSGIRESPTVDGIGGRMIDSIRTALGTAGHTELASLVELGDGGRPLWNWPRLGRAPSTQEVHAVHAANLRAYEKYAPEEIGEKPGQFTKRGEAWFDAIRAGTSSD